LVTPYNNFYFFPFFGKITKISPIHKIMENVVNLLIGF
jgi:hypothetical protein